eukprot:g18654.t1
MGNCDDPGYGLVFYLRTKQLSQVRIAVLYPRTGLMTIAIFRITSGSRSDTKAAENIHREHGVQSVPTHGYGLKCQSTHPGPPRAPRQLRIYIGNTQSVGPDWTPPQLKIYIGNTMFNLDPPPVTAQGRSSSCRSTHVGPDRTPPQLKIYIGNMVSNLDPPPVTAQVVRRHIWVHIGHHSS